MPFDPLDLPLPGQEGDEVELVRTVPSRASEFSGATKARVRAIDVLFEADARGVDIEPLALERLKVSTAQTPLPAHSKDLALLFAENSGEIDDVISTHSEGWVLERMPAVDRAILRMGAAEILYGEKLDAPILLKEYTRIAAELSTDDSAPFVNALLQRIVDMRDVLTT